MPEESANERLREERLRRGWSQQKVADLLGIAVVTVNRWERGKQQPAAYYRLKLSAVFEKSAQELGLMEDEKTELDASTDVQEPLKNTRETPHIFQVEQEDSAKDPSPPYISEFHGPAAEKKASRLSLPFSYNWSDRSPQYKKKRTFILLVLILLVILVPSTFSLVRSSTGRKSAQAQVPTHSVSTPLQSIENKPPTLYDPLLKAGGDSEWEYGGTVCQFTQNGLQMTSQGTNFCSANVREFDNIVFKTDMSLQQGQWAGVIFRADSDGNMYYFSISDSGQYELDMFKPKVHPPFILRTGNSSAIYTGYNKWNVITVEANKSHLSFWVNGIIVTEKDDPTRTNGYVGSCVGSYNTSAYPSAPDITTAATYREAYVWQI